MDIRDEGWSILGHNNSIFILCLIYTVREIFTQTIFMISQKNVAIMQVLQPNINLPLLFDTQHVDILRIGKFWNVIVKFNVKYRKIMDL